MILGSIEIVATRHINLRKALAEEDYALRVNLPTRNHTGDVVYFTLIDFRRSMARAHTCLVWLMAIL
jgi:hypothetical protein